MLSFCDGRSLAKINGGRFNGEIVHVDTGDNKQSCCRKCSPLCIKKKCCRKCNLCKCELEGLGKSLKIEDGKFTQAIDENERQVFYIVGESGSGKTTYASAIVDDYLQVFPNKEFFLFSRKSEDPNIDWIAQRYPGRMNRVLIDQTLVDEPIDINEELFGGGLVMFDDVTTIQNDKIKKAIIKLMEDVLEIGRQNKIYVIINNHLVNPNEKQFGRTIMNEMKSLTFFLGSGNNYQISYALKNYFGMSKKEIETILNHKNSRFVTIFKNYPRVILTEHECFIP